MAFEIVDVLKSDIGMPLKVSIDMLKKMPDSLSMIQKLNQSNLKYIRDPRNIHICWPLSNQLSHLCKT